MRSTRLMTALGAVAALVWSGRTAKYADVSDRETVVFRRFNGAPDHIETPAWIVMQAGSLAAVFAAGGVTRCRRGPREALVVLGVGSSVWAGVKLIKPLVGRGRPDRHLDDVVVRGRPQNGLGYPSGHAAVSLALALIATRPGRWRTTALGVSLLTGCSRMFIGAHLPLDVLGGFAVGTLVGTVTEEVRTLRTIR